MSNDWSTIKTDPALLDLIERAKVHVMTPEESYEQRRSFVRGMCPSNRDYKEWCDIVNRLLPPIIHRVGIFQADYSPLTAADILADVGTGSKT